MNDGDIFVFGIVDVICLNFFFCKNNFVFVGVMGINII